MSSTSEYIITTCGMLAWVTPAAEALLAPVLSGKAPRFRQTGGRLSVEIKRAVWYVLLDNRLQTLSGFVPRIVAALQATGRSVVVQPSPEGTGRQVANRSVMERLQGQERRIAQVMLDETRAQFLLPVRQRESMMVLAAQLYPAARILVVAKNRRRVAELTTALSQGLEEIVYAPYIAETKMSARIYVVTSITFPNLVNLCGGFDLILLDESTLSLSADWQEEFGWFKKQRMYGFRLADQILTPGEQMNLEGICGPVMVNPVNSCDLAAPYARAVFVTPPGGPAPCRPDALQRKREAIWHSEKRNQLIGEFAQALADSHHDALMQMGLVDITDYHFARLQSPSVAILVESVEHARALARLLPGWSVVSACPTASGIGEPAQSPHCIVTLQAARHYQILYVDAIIIATGVAASALPTLVPGSPFQLEVLVIDLADDYDHTAREHACDRADDYTRRGWIVEHSPKRHSTRLPCTQGGKRPTKTRVSRAGAHRPAAK